MTERAFLVTVCERTGSALAVLYALLIASTGFSTTTP